MIRKIRTPRDVEVVKKRLAELAEAEEALLKRVQMIKESDPFWYYEPNGGELSEEASGFLKEWVKAEDVPSRFDSQMDVHMCEAGTVLAGGGNRVGKSTLAPIEVFIHITGKVPKFFEGKYPLGKLAGLPKYKRVRVVGESSDQMAEVVIPKYRHWVPRQYLLKGSWEESFSAQHKILTLYDPGTKEAIGQVQFMSNAQDVKHFQGDELTMVVYDEEPLFEIYKENLLRFGTTKLRQLFCMTPTNGISWVYHELVMKPSKQVRCFNVASVTNRFLNYESMREILSKLPTYQERKMRLLGSWVSLSGLVYGGLFKRDVHVIPPFEVRCQCQQDPHLPKCPAAQFEVFRGFDPHLVTPTACVWVAVDRFENVYVVTSRFRESDIAEVKRGVALQSQGMRLGWSVTDSAADVDLEAFSGLNVYKLMSSAPHKIRSLRLATKGQGSIKTGVDEIKEYLRVNPATGKPRLFVMDTPENEPLIQAFETMERDRGANEERKGMKDRILENKYHLHAAMRYVFMQKLRWHDQMPLTAPDPSYQAHEVAA